MSAYVARRLLATALTLLGVSVLVFGMVRLVPGTNVEQLLGQAAMGSPEVLARFRRFFGPDLPAHLHYIHWHGGALRLALGVCCLCCMPLLALPLDRLPLSPGPALVAAGW